MPKNKSSTVIPKKEDSLPSVVYISQHSFYTSFTCVKIIELKTFYFLQKYYYTLLFPNDDEAVNDGKKSSQVLEELLKIEKLEVVIFSLIEIDGNDSIRRKYQKFCDEHKILCKFFDIQSLYASAAVMQNKLELEYGDRITCLFVRKTISILYIIDNLCSHNAPHCALTSIQTIDLTNFEATKAQILASNPTKIILNFYETPFIHVKATFEALKTSLKIQETFYNDDPPFDFKTGYHNFIMKILRIVNKESPNLLVVNQTNEIFGVIYSSRIKEADIIKHSLIFHNSGRALPLEESTKIDEIDDDLILYSLKNNHLKRLKKIKLTEIKSSSIKITLTLDEHKKPDLKIETFGNPVEEEIPCWLFSCPGNALLFFSENSFEICIKTKNGENQWVLDDQGYCQIPCSFTLTENQIIVGKQAINNPFAINDVIKLISMSFEDLKINNSNLKLTKNQKDQSFLIEFETFRGRRKASPSFLFAFIIKWCLKEIEKITNEIPKSLEFCFDESNENIRRNIHEACEKMEINAYIFDKNGLKAAITVNERKKLRRLKKVLLRPMLSLPLSETNFKSNKYTKQYEKMFGNRL